MIREDVIEAITPVVLRGPVGNQDSYAWCGEIADEALTTQAAEIERLRAAARLFLRLKRSIMIDVGSCHANRGPGASSEMRSDDRDMRNDIEMAYAMLEAALQPSDGRVSRG